MLQDQLKAQNDKMQKQESDINEIMMIMKALRLEREVEEEQKKLQH